jgi:DNA-binding HxlR family transcriptional regulator
MEKDVTQLKRELEELRKAVLGIQQKLEIMPEPQEPLEKPRIVRSGTFTPEMTEAKNLIHESLGSEPLILAFNLRGFCVARGRIWTHETGYSGVASFANDPTLFFIPADKVRENRDCPGRLIEKFFSIFSSEKRVSLMRALLNDETKTSAALKEETGLTEGQFYHHMRELAAAECLVKKDQDQYRLSNTGKILLLVVEALASELRASSYVKPEDFGSPIEVLDVEDKEQSDLESSLGAYEKQLVLEALERNGWVRSKAAAELGIPRPTLNYKMAKHNIVPPEESES